MLTFNRVNTAQDSDEAFLRFQCVEQPDIALIYIDLQDADLDSLVVAQLQVGDLHFHLVNYGFAYNAADWYFDDDHTDASDDESWALAWERDVRIANSVYERAVARFTPPPVETPSEEDAFLEGTEIDPSEATDKMRTWISDHLIDMYDEFAYALKSGEFDEEDAED